METLNPAELCIQKTAEITIKTRPLNGANGNLYKDTKDVAKPKVLVILNWEQI